MAICSALEFIDRRYGWLYRAKPHTSRYTYFLSLSIFRILFGTYILADFLINNLPWFKDLYSINGVFPASTLSMVEQSNAVFFMPWIWQLHSDAFLWAAMVSLPIAALLFIAGYWTRLATIVLLVVELYFGAQNRAATFGGSSLVIMLLYWCMFCPMARYLSVEAALNRLPKNRPYPALPIMLLHGQISLMYMAAAIYKLASPQWLCGVAVTDVLSGNIYAGTRLDWWVLLHFSSLLPLVTWGILTFQMCFPFLVHSPWYNRYTRAFAVAGGITMHMGFLLLMTVGGLPYLCVIYLTLIVPDAAWKILGQKLPKLRIGGLVSSIRNVLPKHTPTPLGPWGVALATGLFVFSIIPLIWDLPRPGFTDDGFQKMADIFAHTQSPNWLRKSVGKLGLHQQGWNFFAPNVNKLNLSYSLTGFTKDRQEIDLMQRWNPNPLRVDSLVNKTYFATHPWLRYFSAINKPTLQGWMRRTAFLEYVCRQVNAVPGQPAVTFATYTVYRLNRDLESGRVGGRQVFISQSLACPEK